MKSIPFSIDHKLLIKLMLLSSLCYLISCGGSSIGGSTQEVDAVVVDFPIAYIKRPLLTGDDNPQRLRSDLTDPTAFQPGAGLYIRDRASPSATERNITDILFTDTDGTVDPYDVKDLAVSYDGKTLIFALRAPDIENADEDEQPTWNLWQYQWETHSLSRIISLDIIAEAGDDTDPYFLPNGRIVFSSTRQRSAKARLLDENKPQFAGLTEIRNTPASVLHTMNSDGSDITQISFNPSHDLNPSVLNDGRIVFSRWDNAGSTSRISLYTMYPDGTQLQAYYGIHSHILNSARIQFTQPQILDNQTILSLVRPLNDSFWGSQILSLNATRFIDADQPINANMNSTESGQQALTSLNLQLDNTLALDGRVNSVFALQDGSQRLLMSWSACRLVTTESLLIPTDNDYFACTTENLTLAEAGVLTEAIPNFGAWLLDPNTQTQLPIVTGTTQAAVTEAIVLQAHTTPDAINNSAQLDQDLVADTLGALHIRSVYDLNGTDTAGIRTLADASQTTADQRPARFLRLIKSVAIPDSDLVALSNTAFGRSNEQLMREIIGYTPIEPDGSVKVAVPANVAFMISVLNADGERTSERHNHWLQVQAGEVLECHGCHADTNDPQPHGRADAEAASANPGETMAETYAHLNGIRRPTTDIVYTDDWTDPSVRSPDIAFTYADADLDTSQPSTESCQSQWTYLCRSVIHYPTHIQPLWSKIRQILDIDGITVLADHTCTVCHSTQDAMNVVQVPAGQLDLTDTPSADEPDHIVSYRELLFTDNQQAIIDNTLVDLETTISPSASIQGAQASRFLATFNSNGTTVDHRGFLTSAELKLIREWLDIGAQYYNNPFSVPQN